MEFRGTMKEITLEDVDYVADLARIELTDDEKQDLVSQLTRILHYVEKLNELDTENVEPTAHILPVKNVMREDEVTPSLSVDEVMSIAPVGSEGMFKVPRIIEDTSSS